MPASTKPSVAAQNPNGGSKPRVNSEEPLW
jgi:hypothetical protein